MKEDVESTTEKRSGSLLPGGLVRWNTESVLHIAGDSLAKALCRLPVSWQNCRIRFEWELLCRDVMVVSVNEFGLSRARTVVVERSLLLFRKLAG